MHRMLARPVPEDGHFTESVPVEQCCGEQFAQHLSDDYAT